MSNSNVALTAPGTPDEKAPAAGEHLKGHNLLRRAVLQLRDLLIDARIWYLRTFLKMDVHPGARISLKANLDLTNPRGIHIGAGTYVTLNVVVLAHDLSRVLHTDTYIGKNCFIGAHAIIMPGVRIGDQCIIGSGSVVTRDVPSQSVVVGNPAKVVRSGIRTIRWGILEDAYNEAVAAELKRQQSSFFE